MSIYFDLNDFIPFDKRAQDEIRSWFRAIDGDPEITFGFEIHRRYITAHVYVLDGRGRNVILEDRDEVARTTVELPLTAPLPQILKDWVSVNRPRWKEDV